MKTKGCVLIVDNNPENRNAWRPVLEGAGYEVDEANDGAEAITQLKAKPADLVILDRRMPEVDGLETLRRLRAAGDDQPVILIASQESVPDAVEAMKLGAIDFLTKPIESETLRKVVDDVMARQAEQRAGTEAVEVVAAVVTVAPAALNLATAKRAINRREFDRATAFLEEAIEQFPTAAEAHALLGVLYECQGQNNAAFHAYKTALLANPEYGPALKSLRKYCENNGLDFSNPAINPAAGQPEPVPVTAETHEAGGP